MSRRAHPLTFPVILTAALLAGGSLSGCGKSETSASLAAEAAAYQKKSDFKAALIQMKNAVVKSPEDAGLRLQLAGLYESVGDGESAEKEVRKAISLGTPVATALGPLTSALALQGEFQKVIDETEPFKASLTPELLVARGKAFLYLGQAGRAEETLNAALKLKPGYGEALLGLALHALASGQPEPAKALLEQAAKSDPKNAEVWMSKGALAARLEQPDEAIAMFTQALAVKPDHRTAHIERAYIQIARGKFAEARADIGAARKIAPRSAMGDYAQALLEHTEGKHASALEAIQKVLRVAPEHMPSILLAGAIQLSLGSYEQAENQLKKYIEKYPDNLYARKMLASTQLRSAQPAGAAATLAPVLANTSDAQLLALAGEASMQSRDFAKATDYFSKATELQPKAAPLRTSLGLSRLGQGDNARAIEELERATTLDPKSQQASLALVRSQISLKQYDKALATALSLEKQQPNNALLRNLTGGIYAAKDDIANARASFNRALELQPDYFGAVSNLALLDVAERKPGDAKKRFTAFLAKDPKHLSALMALADLESREGNSAEATKLAERAYAIKPDSVPVAARMAGQFMRNGDNERALTVARKLLTTKPDDPQLLDMLGQVQMASNDHANALETYSKLANVAPRSVEAQLRLAAVHSANKNYPAAVDDIKKALAIEPDNTNAQVAMVHVASRIGDKAQVMNAIKQIQRTRPTLPLGFMLEGDVMAVEKKFDVAIRAYEQAYQLTKSGTVAVKIANALIAQGKQKEAEARIAQHKKAQPNDPATAVFDGEKHLANKQYAQAVAALEAGLKSEPNSAVILNNLAYAYHGAKDPRALATAEQAARLAPGHFAVQDTLGWILVEKGDLARGTALLQKAVAAAPEAGEIRFHLASAWLKAGDKDKARKELDTVLKGKPFAQLDEAKAMRSQL